MAPAPRPWYPRPDTAGARVYLAVIDTSSFEGSHNIIEQGHARVADDVIVADCAPHGVYRMP